MVMIVRLNCKVDDLWLVWLVLLIFFRAEILLIVVPLLHIFTCPYTKVEESFNLQAIHDILYWQGNIEKYDHLEFPGVVPRTFLGPLVISVFCSPLVFLSTLMGYSKYTSLLMVRSVLALLVVWPLLRIKKRIEESLGRTTAIWFTLITVSQFHFVFYLSRTLPNTMALILVLFSYDLWLSQHHGGFIICSAAAIIIFRAELALLLGLIMIGELLSRRADLFRAIVCALPSGIFFLGLTVIVDSYFWKRLLWPEGEVLWFNVYLNKSGDWGTSPFLWYFYSAIPRALATSLLFVPVGLWMERRIRTLLLPALLFVLAYSLLPHKELRFVIYTIPLFNLAAATACSRLWMNRMKSNWHKLAALSAAGHLLANGALTSFLLLVSQANYPGGSALAQLHALRPASANVTVHIDVLAAQTGVSRFIQLHDNWRYDKTERLKSGGPELRMFTHLIVEAKSKQSSSLRRYANSHEIIAIVPGFSHIHASYHQFPPIRIRSKPRLFVLESRQPPKQPDFSFVETARIRQQELLQELQPADEDGPATPDLDFEFSNHFDGDDILVDKGALENHSEE